MAWNDLTDEQIYAATELGILFFNKINMMRLPSYEWMKENSDIAREAQRNTLIAFGRIVLDTCKSLQSSKGIWRKK